MAGHQIETQHIITAGGTYKQLRHRLNVNIYVIHRNNIKSLNLYVKEISLCALLKSSKNNHY